MSKLHSPNKFLDKSQYEISSKPFISFGDRRSGLNEEDQTSGQKKGLIIEQPCSTDDASELSFGGVWHECLQGYRLPWDFSLFYSVHAEECRDRILK
jgi:hypothetical protein